MAKAIWTEGFEELPAGDYLAAVVDCAEVEGKDFKDPNKTKPQFEWRINVWVDGEWKERRVWTPRVFTIIDPKNPTPFISNLNKLVRACGLPVPQTKEAVLAWNTDDLIGLEFCYRVTEDDENPDKILRKLIPISRSKTVSALRGVEEEQEEAEPPVKPAPAKATTGNGAAKPAPVKSVAKPAPAEKDPFIDA